MLIQLIPSLMAAKRCSIDLVDPESKQMSVSDLCAPKKKHCIFCYTVQRSVSPNHKEESAILFTSMIQKVLSYQKVMNPT